MSREPSEELAVRHGLAYRLNRGSVHRDVGMAPRRVEVKVLDGLPHDSVSACPRWRVARPRRRAAVHDYAAVCSLVEYERRFVA